MNSERRQILVMAMSYRHAKYWAIDRGLKRDQFRYVYSSRDLMGVRNAKLVILNKAHYNDDYWELKSIAEHLNMKIEYDNY